MKLNLAIRIFLLFILFGMLASCVPQRKYAELEKKNDLLNRSNDSLRFKNEHLTSQNDAFAEEIDEMTTEVIKLRAQLNETESLYDKVRKSYEQLDMNYQRLLSNNERDRSNLDAELRKMQEELRVKDGELTNREAELIKKEVATENLKKELDQLKNDLGEREKKVQELQDAINAQDSAVSVLKDKLTAALLPFKESGLTVTERNGKVYVSMDAQLLFQSGKTEIDQKGREAILKLCESLQGLEGFEIMVEGHTDDVPIKTARFEDNWDLSVLRATSVTRFMIDKGSIDPIRIIPSGRSEYLPVDERENTEARKKNRRIEIILTPDLGELMHLIND